MTAPQRVLLLGGGYVTLHAYAALVRRAGRRIRRGEVEVVVLSADDCHSFHGFTGEVVAGRLPYEVTRTSLAAAMPLARVVRGRAVRVDTVRKHVVYETPAGHQDRLGYDQLVVGTGSREPLRQVPGLERYGSALRGPGDIAALVAQVDDLAREGAGAATVVVAGGGLGGVELAAAVAARGSARVVLVHGGDRIVPALRRRRPRLADRCEAELERLGVEVRTGVRLVGLTADGAAFSDGSWLRADAVVAATGQRPVVVPGLADLLRDEHGRLVTDRHLRVHDSVWAAGDAARVEHPRTGEPVPANALWALKAGAHAGRNVARALAGRRSRPFHYLGIGQAAAFGSGRAVAELYGVPLTGWAAWLLRLAFFLRFMPSRRNAALVLRSFLIGEGPTVAADQGAVPAYAAARHRAAAEAA